MKETNFVMTKKFTPDVIEEIIRIQKEEGLTPKTFVKNAKQKDNPLHSLFSVEDWDKDKAAEMWLEQKARMIINEVKVIIEEKEIYAFENVHVSIETNSEKTEKQYIGICDILDDATMRTEIIQDAKRRIKYWRDKYAIYKEFSPIIKVIDETFDKI